MEYNALLRVDLHELNANKQVFFISLIIHTRLVTVPFNSRHSFTMFKRRLMLLSEFSSFLDGVFD